MHFGLAEAVDREGVLMACRSRVEAREPGEKRQRLLGALWGTMVGDSLGMPSDGSINLKAHRRDYGRIEDLTAPHCGSHADGGLHLSLHSHLEHIGREPTMFHLQSPLEEGSKLDFLCGTQRYYGHAGVHPHVTLSAGHSTLTAQVAKLLLCSLGERATWDRDDVLQRYLAYMLHRPDKDVWIDPHHFEFFDRLARGNKPYFSAGIGKAASEATTTALVQLVPLIVFLLPEVLPHTPLHA